MAVNGLQQGCMREALGRAEGNAICSVYLTLVNQAEAALLGLQAQAFPSRAQMLVSAGRQAHTVAMPSHPHHNSSLQMRWD
jgi:hypothetical protein